MIDINIQEINSKYYVLIKLLGSNRIYKEFSTMDDALNFKEEFFLNSCLFLMYGTDDKKVLKKYAKQTYKGEVKAEYDYESYKKFLLQNLFSRKVQVNSNSVMEFNNSKYTKINDIRDITFLRNNIKYKYFQLDKIRNILRKILLLKGKKQGGFNLTNLYWDSTIPSQLCNYLFKELITDYNPIEKDAIKKYTANYYQVYNDLLYGKAINTKFLTTDFIDSFFEMLKCFKSTPYDLYLYRGAGNDKKYCQNGNNFEYRQFISTSLSAPSVHPFVSGEQYQIIIPKGTKVIFKGPSLERDISNENEVIILPSKYTIEKENNNLTVLKYQESISPSLLLLDNLTKNKDYYIEQIGLDKYQEIYDYILKKSYELKKIEIKDSHKSKTKMTSTFLNELSLLFNYYGVHNQKEDQEIDQYRL